MIWRSSRSASLRGPATLVELLHERAEEAPDRAAYTFLGDGPTELEASSETWSRGELLQRAQAVAAWLQERTRPGDRALMLYPSGLDFVAAFFGCLEVGIVAVPAYPPDPMRLERSVPRLAAIAADAETRVVLTTKQLLAQTKDLTARFPQLAHAEWLATDDLLIGAAEPIPIDVTPESLAFFQYTSGSTGTPKGVMVSHANLVHNLRCFRDVLELEHTEFVSWLPLFHDMGLIQGVLLALYVGNPCTLMAPGTFIKSPLRWMQAISRAKRAMSAAPNFAYKLCLRKVSPKERDGLDLSSWDIALNAAEPVRAETIERFSEYFAPAGFRRKAFWPGYGLAEATLMVTGGPRLAGPKIVPVLSSSLEGGSVEEARDPQANGVIPYVGCGQVIPDHELAVVDPATLQPLPAAKVGEIWTRGPSIACGYWGRPAETHETFFASLAGETGGRWMRTGDLGFVIGDELFISSRMKDLIIIRGRNHYPQDIELTVEQSHASLRPGGGAAFSVDVGDEERLVIVQEADPARASEADSVFSAILEAVGANHELYPQAIVLIRPGALPKTSSGKIQRRGTRAAFLKGELDALATWTRDRREIAGDAPLSRVLKRGGDRARILAAPPQRQRVIVSMFLMGQIAAVLRLPSPWLEVDRPLGSLGFDSLTALELKNRLEVSLDVLLPKVDFLKSPTVSELTTLILTQLLDGHVASSRGTSVSKGPVEQFPLSHGQKALWFLQQVSPESAAYNIVVPVRIVSQVDVGTLKQAFGAVIERHAALRVTFSAPDGVPLQTVRSWEELPWREVDGTAWSEDEVQAFADSEAWRPFDLAAGPLFRAIVVRRPHADHVLLLVMHHSVVDFWSISLLIRELGVFYTALMRKTEPMVEPTRFFYSDFVEWQRLLLDGEEGKQHLEYWLAELGGELPVLDLPTDFPRPAIQSFRGASVAFRVPPRLVKLLRGLAASEGATIYTVLLAAFQVLLARYTGQGSVVVGSPSAGRNRADWVDVVGYFVNTLVLRADFQDDPTFRALLGRCREKVLGALEHDELPFSLLVQHLLSGRDPSRSPIFQAMFGIEQERTLEEDALTPFALREAGARVSLGDLTLESMPVEHRVAQFDLTMMMAEVHDEFVGSLEYNTSLFKPATIERMVASYLTLLDAAVDAPDTPTSLLRIMPDDELHRCLVGPNRTSRELPETLVHRMVEAAVDRSPDADAVSAGAQTLTYRALDEAANRLAHYLTDRGIGGEDRVGVCLEKSVDLAVSLLAVLKAGAAYVPLDADFPRERLAYMLEDAQVRALITTTALEKKLQLPAPLTVRVDGEQAELGRRPATRPDVVVSPRSLAYVLYTSGSTGKPKGVMIEHRSVVNFLSSMREHPGVAQTDVLLSITTPSFDIFGLELFLPLTVGAKVVFANKALVRDGSLLSDYLARSAVTMVQGTPSAFQMLVDAGGPLRSQLKVLCGGEPLPSSLSEVLLGRVGALHNMYGPTETTIWSSVASIEPGKPVTLGQPIDNTEFFVLDAQLQPVPAGVRGELFIAGAGLARGYLNRPELTEERFVELDLPLVGRRRAYRTGDWVRWTSDGALLFLGRRDQQVKLRGYRVELGEIEAVLREFPGVRDAVVLVIEDDFGGHLTGFVTARPGQSVAPDAVRAFARQKLPEYMVPSLLVQMEALPFTLNQKIDRAALLGAASALSVGEGYVPPANPLEALILQLWREALGSPRLGPQQSFFDAGGHSMLAAVVMTRLGAALNLRLPLHTIFSAPTAAAMARLVESLQADDTPGSSAPSLSLEAQVQLEPALSPLPLEADPSSPKNVLLTGATGFLGAFLLEALIAQTSAKVHCLVRDAHRQGWARMVANLRRYGLWLPEMEGRIELVEGDLTQPLGGLSPDDFERLSRVIDSIYHNGALVDFVRPFRLLKAANVLGTIEMLRLAATRRGKALHFVSTLSVFPSLPPGIDRVADERDPLVLGAHDRIHGDYAESKWVADRTLMLAQERSFPVAIYRPGIVYGHSITGVGRTDDFVHAFVKGCVLLGKWPALDTWVNLTPVDYVAQGLVSLSLGRSSLGQVFHLTSPTRLLVEELADMIRAFGYPLETLPYLAWRGEIARSVESESPNPLVALLPYLTEESGELFRQPFFDATNSLAGLEGTGVACPPAEEELVFRWLRQLVSVGFLPPPAEARRGSGARLAAWLSPATRERILKSS